MKKKTVLICGATGFIGRNLVESFSRDPAYDVIGVYHRRPPFSLPGIRWVMADLTCASQVERVMDGVSILIQAAAVTSGIKDTDARPHLQIAENAVMNSFLFRAAYEHQLDHVVFFSCSVMLQSSSLPLSERDFDANAELHPRYFGAGWTKVYLEKMCEFYSRLGSTKFTAIRHSNVYGPHDKFDLELSHVFGATITKVMTAVDSIAVWGTGEEARDLIYVADLVDMVHRAIDRQPNSFAIYNCGAGSAITIKELTSRIIAASGRSLTTHHDLSMPTIPTSLFLNCSKAQRELAWQPRYSLDEGIQKTIQWWRRNIAANAEMDHNE